MLHIIGEDNVCLETDYPHSDCKWPDNIPHALHQMRALKDELKYKIMRGNAERIYRFKPSEPPFART
jgi:predicted TIM-barrel fold metal-dependent hydrolase